MPDPKLYIEVLNDGTQDLYIRDAEAQEEIEKIKETIKNGASYIGKFVSAVVGGETVTTLKDGDAVTSITTTKGTFVPGTPASGQYKLNEGDFTEIQGTAGKPSVEFMWNGTAMDEFGSTSLLKSLAFKDSASGSYTPAGTNAATNDQKRYQWNDAAWVESQKNDKPNWDVAHSNQVTIPTTSCQLRPTDRLRFCEHRCNTFGNIHTCH